MKRIFIDADIILDLLTQREPFYPFAAELFSLIEIGKIEAYSSPIIFTNIHYILRKLQSKTKAISNLQKLRTLICILPIDEKIIDLALASDFKDFEDAIQYYVSIDNNIDYLITRNIKDYKNATINILTAQDFLNLYKCQFD